MAKYEYTMGKDLDLKAEQEVTLQTPVMKANIILRSMYLMMDILYGFKRTLPKFKVIELLARQPYWAWELGGYNLITRKYASPKFTKKEDTDYALRHIDMGRKSQDNEQWHLTIIEDIMRQQGVEQGWIKGTLMPRLMVLNYILLEKVMYRFKPEWSFAMNARFESHAEHEYMHLVQEHPEWEDQAVETAYFERYPRQSSMANLFRRIGLDERDHMTESKEEYERITGRELT